jgi:DNA-binding NarL/FixJ family response regulator
MQQRILIADDHPLVRKGLIAIFNSYFNIFEITEACSCNETMKKLIKNEYSHLILDMVFMDGTALEILPNIISLYPTCNIMIFSMQPVATYQRVLKQYRVNHYLSKASPEDSIVCKLGRFLSNEIPQAVETGVQIQDNPFSLLTARELEILHYILKGLGSNEIGKILNIKYNTVSTARARIFRKSRTNNMVELFDLAALHNVN